MTGILGNYRSSLLRAPDYRLLPLSGREGNHSHQNTAPRINRKEDSVSNILSARSIILRGRWFLLARTAETDWERPIADYCRCAEESVCSRTKSVPPRFIFAINQVLFSRLTFRLTLYYYTFSSGSFQQENQRVTDLPGRRKYRILSRTGRLKMRRRA